MSAIISELSVAQAYTRLVESAAQFSPREAGRGVAEFIGFAKPHLRIASAGDCDLVAWLEKANRQADLVPVAILTKDWIPYAYDARSGEVRWCLPIGRATQPFHDQYITHCRQHPVNALLTPRSSLQCLVQYARDKDVIPPAGFIFHLSRCGSTLVAGCLATLKNISVLSESPLLTEILLTQCLAADERRVLLRLLLHLQSGAERGRPQVIVKWNAWDLFYWSWIRELYPKVPVLLLTRDPVAVMASHARGPGRHMSGDPGLAHVHPVFSGLESAESLLEHRIRVLETLMSKMAEVVRETGVTLVDYGDLTSDKILEICDVFGIHWGAIEREIIKERMQYNAKEPDRVFTPDRVSKEILFETPVRRRMCSQLDALYRSLISIPNKK